MIQCFPFLSPCLLCIHLSHFIYRLTPPAIFCFPLLLLSLCSLPETFTVSTTLEISTERDHVRESQRKGEGQTPGTTSPHQFPVRDAAEKGGSKVTAPIFAVTAELSTYMPRRLFFLYFYAHIFMDVLISRSEIAQSCLCYSTRKYIFAHVSFYVLFYFFNIFCQRIKQNYIKQKDRKSVV